MWPLCCKYYSNYRKRDPQGLPHSIKVGNLKIRGVLNPNSSCTPAMKPLAPCLDPVHRVCPLGSCLLLPLQD
ncbi:unnamed protein product [Arctogadus glacialis]